MTEEAISELFLSASQQSQVALCAATAEALLPSYAAYCHQTGGGNPTLYRFLLDEAWRNVSDGHISQDLANDYLGRFAPYAPWDEREQRLDWAESFYALDSALKCCAPDFKRVLSRYSVAERCVLCRLSDSILAKMASTTRWAPQDVAAIRSAITAPAIDWWAEADRRHSIDLAITRESYRSQGYALDVPMKAKFDADVGDMAPAWFWQISDRALADPSRLEAALGTISVDMRNDFDRVFRRFSKRLFDRTLPVHRYKVSQIESVAHAMSEMVLLLNLVTLSGKQAYIEAWVNPDSMPSLTEQTARTSIALSKAMHRALSSGG